jgi:hypothetical protein
MATRYDDDEEDNDAFLRRLIPCEEDRRRLFPGMAWTGGYRWFRSMNIIDLEAYRSRRITLRQPRRPWQ